MRKVKEVVLDRALYLWFSQRRSKSDPISGPLLCEKNLELPEKLGGSTDFKGQNEDVLCQKQNTVFARRRIKVKAELKLKKAETLEKKLLDIREREKKNARAKFEEKQFKTLNKETATHIGIREAEDWFGPIDLAKECDIYISSRSGSHKEIPITYGYTQDPFKNKSQNFKTKIKENYPQYHEREK
ncbi:hypothetical protein TNCV_1701551 [Trichonephila clavipes]|nr:hypothetical protein TNCV_1701551 [Trichonephila clavipes]